MGTPHLTPDAAERIARYLARRGVTKFSWKTGARGGRYWLPDGKPDIPANRLYGAAGQRASAAKSGKSPPASKPAPKAASKPTPKATPTPKPPTPTPPPVKTPTPRPARDPELQRIDAGKVRHALRGFEGPGDTADVADVLRAAGNVRTGVGRASTMLAPVNSGAIDEMVAAGELAYVPGSNNKQVTPGPKWGKSVSAPTPAPTPKPAASSPAPAPKPSNPAKPIGADKPTGPTWRDMAAEVAVQTVAKLAGLGTAAVTVPLGVGYGALALGPMATSLPLLLGTDTNFLRTLLEPMTAAFKAPFAVHDITKSAMRSRIGGISKHAESSEIVAAVRERLRYLAEQSGQPAPEIPDALIQQMIGRAMILMTRKPNA